MQGTTTANSMKVWLMTKKAKIVQLKLNDLKTGEVHSRTIATDTVERYKKYAPLTFSFSKLNANQEYDYEIVIDGRIIQGDKKLSTLNPLPGDTLRFFILSCAFTPPTGLRFLHPGIENRTYKYLARKDAEFTLWIGDYFYYLKWHFSSKKGMLKKNVWTRKLNKLNRFQQTQPQYSIWDDHDYGPDNSTGDFKNKEHSLEVFKLFWPNPYYGIPEAPGCFFHFSHGDADYFMTDNRYYRTLPAPIAPEPAYFGRAQLDWLKKHLLESTAAFKFIATGSQVLNKVSTHERLRQFPDEMHELFSFIEKNKISGVIFLTGDRHHSELLRTEGEIHYPLYDFTSSGVTSFRRRTRRTKESDNPDRVPGTLADFQNFGRVTIAGEPENRVCILEVFTKRGKPVWNYTIKAADLK